MATETSTSSWGEGPNAEAVQAWDGPLFDRWIRFRHLVTDGLAIHGEEALRLAAPQPGERVLDIGCGLGDTTQRIAEIVGPSGEALGVDAAERFVEAARQEAAAAGSGARFTAADVQEASFDERFDVAFSRMGTMFFANPVVALRNVRWGLVPGGRLAMAVWRRKLDNDWLHRAETIVERIVDRPEEHDEPTCGPGPFSMADADTTSDVVQRAGFTDVALHRRDHPILIGRDIEEAIALVTAMGPAGELLRLAGERAAHLHGQVHEALRAGLAEFAGPDGVRAPSSTWVVTATAP